MSTQTYYSKKRKPLHARPWLMNNSRLTDPWDRKIEATAIALRNEGFACPEGFDATVGSAYSEEESSVLASALRWKSRRPECTSSKETPDPIRFQDSMVRPLEESLNGEYAIESKHSVLDTMGCPSLKHHVLSVSSARSARVILDDGHRPPLPPRLRFGDVVSGVPIRPPKKPSPRFQKRQPRRLVELAPSPLRMGPCSPRSAPGGASLLLQRMLRPSQRQLEEALPKPPTSASREFIKRQEAAIAYNINVRVSLSEKQQRKLAYRRRKSEEKRQAVGRAQIEMQRRRLAALQTELDTRGQDKGNNRALKHSYAQPAREKKAKKGIRGSRTAGRDSKTEYVSSSELGEFAGWGGKEDLVLATEEVKVMNGTDGDA